MKHALSTADFEFVSRFLHDRLGIFIDDDKRYLVKARLASLLRSTEFDSIADVVDALRTRPSSIVTRRVLESMTTNETFFFRDGHAFDALENHLIPQLLRARRDRRELRIWSAACSSGQEPYSIAMHILRHFGSELASWSVDLVATDYNETMLDQARGGRFNQVEINRGLPATHLLEHFRRRGARWEIEAPIRDMVEFHMLNLADDTWPDVGIFDIVFLRNVLIYFDDVTRRAVLHRVRRHLADDGFLVVGSCETSMIDDDWSPLMCGEMLVYRPFQARLDTDSELADEPPPSTRSLKTSARCVDV